jgi:hypothetical protein
MRHQIDAYLRPFQLNQLLHEHTAHVLSVLPDEVLSDVMGEPGVLFCDIDARPGVIFQVPVKSPTCGGAARSVVLKRTLCRRPVDFVRWLIAHEIAHAHLKNGGRWEGDDPELAADALAADWGFPRPLSF